MKEESGMKLRDGITLGPRQQFVGMNGLPQKLMSIKRALLLVNS